MPVLDAAILRRLQSEIYPSRYAVEMRTPRDVLAVITDVPRKLPPRSFAKLLIAPTSK